jgi:hypothetical protein
MDGWSGAGRSISRLKESSFKNIRIRSERHLLKLVIASAAKQSSDPEPDIWRLLRPAAASGLAVLAMTSLSKCQAIRLPEDKFLPVDAAGAKQQALLLLQLNDRGRGLCLQLRKGFQYFDRNQAVVPVAE